MPPSITQPQDAFEHLFLPNKQQPLTEQVESPLARPEMHMFLRPYFLLDKHADKLVGFETTEVVTVNGKQIERYWHVKPDEKYGMPGPVERDVLLVLYEIAYERYLSKGLLVPPIMPIGSIRSVLKRLGLSNCGQNATAIKLALKRLVHTTCKSENSFFDKTRNLFVTEAFHILRGVGIAGESDGNGGTIEESFVVFDDRIRDNLNSRYLMVLNLVFLRGLNSDIAKHLYALLSHWLWRASQTGHWRVEYNWLAQHLGIKVCDKLWRAKKQLKLAHEELLLKQYIAACDWDGWSILYFPGSVFNEEQARRAVARENAIEQTTLIPHAPKPSVEYDPLLPLLNLFAQRLPMAEGLLHQKGLTSAQAEALCVERNIPLKSTE